MDENDRIDDGVFGAVQERLEYTDAQLETFEKRPFSSKILRPETIEQMVRTNVVFEVVNLARPRARLRRSRSEADFLLW